MVPQMQCQVVTREKTFSEGWGGRATLGGGSAGIMLDAGEVVALIMGHNGDQCSGVNTV